MDLQLVGKRALVTGSTAGIGFAIAKGLAREGAAVIVNGRTTKRVDEAVAALNKAGLSGKLEGLAADLGTADGTRKAIERFPEVDILVNNVGHLRDQALRKYTRRRLASVLRSEHPQRCAPQPPQSPWNETAQLGTDCVYLQRVGHPDPGGDDSLWHDQDRTTCDRAWTSRDHGGHECYRQLGAARSDGLGRRKQLRGELGPRSEDNASPRHNGAVETEQKAEKP